MPIASRLARGCRPRGCRAPARRALGRRVRYVIGAEPGQVNGRRWWASGTGGAVSGVDAAGGCGS
ncbi:tryptophan biosynthesis modulator TrpM [Streptomyces uncialis]|uniref:tryptophan biosynthesis modulator TrpM n=1 Tax=Streptomyces uncialis TaxID=1048205 RepID=UPI00093C659E|nr:hypothetical protein [Streptomyces uncialis]